jgi:replication factor C subunit 1
MDEVDGMSGNEDHGGIKALIEIIKVTKTPIIFICNDIYNPKLKSLINHCLDIRFTKPDKWQVIQRLQKICAIEHLNINRNSLEYVCDSFQCDIRQILNYLEMLSKKKTLNNIEEDCKRFNKDTAVTINTFDVCKKLLDINDKRKREFKDDLNLFFIDFELTPNLIYENYLSCYNNNNNRSLCLENIANTSQYISFADNIDYKIRTANEWSLLPDKGIHSTVIPSIISATNSNIYPRFPEHFGAISSLKKTKRILKELKQLFKFNGTCFAVKNEIAPLIYMMIVYNIIDKGKNGFNDVVKIFTKYKLNSTLFKDLLLECQSDVLKNMYNKITPSIKTAFSKKVNECCSFGVVKQNKKNKKEGNEERVEKRDEDGNIIEEEIVNDDDENEESEIIETFTKKTKPKGKTNKK